MSRTQLALKLYKGAQSDSSDTIRQDVVPTNLDRVSLRQRADQEQRVDCEEPDPVRPAMAFIVMMQSEIQLILRKILLFPKSRRNAVAGMLETSENSGTPIGDIYRLY